MFLHQCLQSIVSQLLPGDELFVVDGGSTDQSVAVLKAYAANITRWVSEPDSGQAEAVNKALAWARGDAIVWVNSDDALMPNALSRLRQTWRRDVDFVIFDSVWIDRNCRSATYYPVPARFSIRDLRDGAVPLTQPSCVFSRAIYRRLGGLNQKLHYSLDYDFLVRAIKLVKPTFVGVPFGINRVHGETKTSQRAKLVSELSQTALTHFGPDAVPYPSNLLDKYRATIFLRYSPVFIFLACWQRLVIRNGLPGRYSFGLRAKVLSALYP